MTIFVVFLLYFFRWPWDSERDQKWDQYQDAGGRFRSLGLSQPLGFTGRLAIISQRTWICQCGFKFHSIRGWRLPSATSIGGRVVSCQAVGQVDGQSWSWCLCFCQFGGLDQEPTTMIKFLNFLSPFLYKIIILMITILVEYVFPLL